MFPTRLMQLLAEGGITPGNVGRLHALTDEWYTTEPNLITFALRAIFRELANEWDDPQGIPTSQYAPFESRLLPELKRLAPLISASNPEPARAALDDLVRTFHSCSAAVKSQ